MDMASPPSAPPVLATPDVQLEEAVTTVVQPVERSGELFDITYEIERTLSEIKHGGWQRVALQFPDDLLPDAPRVYTRLQGGLAGPDHTAGKSNSPQASTIDAHVQSGPASTDEEPVGPSLFILGDTSYSACCIDEIAAEHIDADVVVHYGRACLSPPARLPVIHVFTIQALDHANVVSDFERMYPEKDAKVIIAADMPYASHLPSLHEKLQVRGYENIFQTTTLHDPSSLIPNRTIPPIAVTDPQELASWRLFHISDPPPALLLTLASRVSSIHIYSTAEATSSNKTLQASTSLVLRRRYGLLTRLSRASIIGILVNTLSVHAYQAALEGTQARIIAAGKKPYVFAMGRLNAAKIANFAEVDGWVVLGCWESSLIENTDFDKPIVAPFELELALKSDAHRIWTGEWRGDFTNMLPPLDSSMEAFAAETGNGADHTTPDDPLSLESDSESEPPEFDLRTGKYITPSNPLGGKKGTTKKKSSAEGGSHSLVRRAKGDLAVIGGEVSPGAQYLKDKRTWRGLGSDFEIAYEEDERPSTAIKEGRSGIARGYDNEKPIR